jgi:hypothetical protein
MQRVQELRPIRHDEPHIARYTDEVVRLILPSMQLASTLQIAGTAAMAALNPPIIEYWQLENVKRFCSHSIEHLQRQLGAAGSVPSLQDLDAASHSVHLMQLVAEVYMRAKLASDDVGAKLPLFEKENWGPRMRRFLVDLAHAVGARAGLKSVYDVQSITDHLDAWVPHTEVGGGECELFTEFNESDSALPLLDDRGRPRDRLHSRLRLKIIASTLAFVAYLSRADTVEKDVGASREDVPVELLLGVLQWIIKVCCDALAGTTDRRC